MSLKIVSLEAQNIMRLRAVNIEPTGNVVVLGGENGQGKSAVLNCIRMTLGGQKETPDVPLRRGATDGVIRLDLGELSAELTVDAGGRGKLTVRDADGKRQGSPQAILDKLYSKVAFNPLEFATKKPAEQMAILKQIVGLDFTDLEAKRAKLYEERTGIGRVRDDAESRVNTYPISCMQAPDEEVSVAELVQQKQRADEVNAAFERAVRASDAAEAEVNRIRALLEKAEADMESARDAFTDLHPRVDTSSIVQRIATAEETNRAVRAKRDRAAAVEVFKAKDRAYLALTKQLEAIDAEKSEKLEAAMAKMPIPGLGFSDSGVTFKGLPFDAGSKAEKMKVSLAIGCALHPALGVILLEDASLLDKASMRVVYEVAEEHDMQIWIERVGGNDPGAIIIEDGEIATFSEDV